MVARLMVLRSGFVKGAPPEAESTGLSKLFPTEKNVVPSVLI